MNWSAGCSVVRSVRLSYFGLFWLISVYSLSQNTIEPAEISQNHPSEHSNNLLKDSPKENQSWTPFVLVGAEDKMFSDKTACPTEKAVLELHKLVRTIDLSGSSQLSCTTRTHRRCQLQTLHI